MKTLILLGLFASGSLSATASAQDDPALSRGLRDAIAICEQGMDGDIALPRHATLYTPMTEQQGLPLEMRTTADAPPLIQRFAGTTRAGRGANPLLIEVGSENGVIWIVQSPHRAACDTAVTGLQDPKAASAALVDDMLADGWRLRHSEGVGDDAMPLYRYLLMRDLPGEEAGQVRAVLVQGLNVGADPEGIQFELLMMDGTER